MPELFRSNPLLNPPPDEGGSSRKRLLAASVVLHVILGAIVWVLPARFGNDSDEPEPTEIVFYSPDDVKPPPIPPPPVELPAEPILVAENEPTPEPLPEPVIPIVHPVVRNDPRPVQPRPPEPVVARVERPKPEVRTAEPKRPRREVKVVGFGKTDNTKTKRARTIPVVATIGGFNADPRDEPAGRNDTRVVSAASFGDASTTNLPARGKPASRQVSSTGFTGDVAVNAARPATGGSVRQGGFGDGVGAAKRSAPRRLPAANPDQPVEILSKVKPVYTDEARRMRIEGEVVLEVTFVASGKLRVVRVVGGLGHGLDEAAMEAAAQIKFKPARRHGRPIDHTATLRVVFRLA